MEVAGPECREVLQSLVGLGCYVSAPVPSDALCARLLGHVA